METKKTQKYEYSRGISIKYMLLRTGIPYRRVYLSLSALFNLGHDNWVAKIEFPGILGDVYEYLTRNADVLELRKRLMREWILNLTTEAR